MREKDELWGPAAVASPPDFARSVAGSQIRDLNSLFFAIHSLIGAGKVPVPLRREFRCKLLNSLAD
jgi:hypothetical protein